MHPASHTYQYPKVTPVASHGAGGAKPAASTPPSVVAEPPRPQH